MFPERWMSTDAMVENVPTSHEIHIFFCDEGFVVMFPMPGGRWRVSLNLDEPNKPRPPATFVDRMVREGKWQPEVVPAKVVGMTHDVTVFRMESDKRIPIYQTAIYLCRDYFSANEIDVCKETYNVRTTPEFASILLQLPEGSQGRNRVSRYVD